MKLASHVDTTDVDRLLPGGTRVTLVIRLTEPEALRFQKLLGAAMEDGNTDLLTRRIIDVLEVLLPTEDIRKKISGHLFAVYMDNNFDGVRFGYPQRRSDA